MPQVKILLDEKQLNDGVDRLAGEINATYGDRPLTIIGVLTGSIVLMADVIRKLQMPLACGCRPDQQLQRNSTRCVND